jgi:hypothetical protein
MTPPYKRPIQKRELESCTAKSGSKNFQVIWDFLLQFVAFINGIRAQVESAGSAYRKPRKTTLLCDRERLLWALLSIYAVAALQSKGLMSTHKEKR